MVKELISGKLKPNDIIKRKYGKISSVRSNSEMNKQDVKNTKTSMVYFESSDSVVSEENSNSI